jgi:FtsP/CotA-like multicopper oxidase with cupredoxin domain
VTVPLEATMPAAPLPRPLFSVRRGRIVVLALANRTEAAQVVHLHGHSARLLDRLDDGWKPFWMDTLLVEPRATERIAFLADNPGKWAIDARALDRDAAGLAGWFEVT